MIKMRRTMKSNAFFGVTLFLAFLVLWGCSKEVAPPEVEVPVEEVAEIPQEPEEALPVEPEIAAEPVEPIDTQVEGPPIEEEPVEIAVVEPEPEPEPVEEFVEPVVEVFEPEPEPDPEPVVEVFEPEPEPEPVFVAPPAEEMQTASLPQSFEEEKALQDIHFEYDRDQLTSQNKEILRSNANWMKANPSARVEIQGHADERGTNNYNLGLGERRAMQTKKYLISLGVDESRLYTISYGEEKPFCFESNENCWWENRRAHFTVAE